MKLSLFFVAAAAARLLSGESKHIDDDAAGTAFDSWSAACDACKAEASESCTHYLTAVCSAGNVHDLDAKHGNKDVSDKDEWHWAMDGDHGGNYKICFANVNSEKYIDNFGDKYDPNESKFVDCQNKMALLGINVN